MNRRVGILGHASIAVVDAADCVPPLKKRRCSFPTDWRRDCA